MKSYFAVPVFLVLIFMFISCEQDVSDDPTYSVIHGTISVADNSYWAYMELGVFSGGSSGEYPDIDVDDDGNGVYQYRVYYSLSDDGSDVSCTPLAGGSYSISDTSGTSSSYSFELPSSLPDTDEEYILAAWYDADGQADLDLKDQDPFWNSTVAAQGEFNRLSTKGTFDNDDNPTTLAIMNFTESQDLNGNPTGNYKYYGYDNNSYNEYTELDRDTDSGFDFNITANTGW